MSLSERSSKPENKRRSCRIVIAGANFAGLTTAVNLPRNYSVNVIDCRTNFEFLPNIHELLSGIKKPESLRIDRKRLVERAGHRFIRDKVTSIDPLKQKVYTSGRKRMPYDICVVAIGGVNNTFGIAGAAKFGLPFKTVAQCQHIARRLEALSHRKQGMALFPGNPGLGYNYLDGRRNTSPSFA
ncbi:MAG: FAD-dependent oxidoreductase [Deltaproteobacteria bacterium]|nr:FAD-dependent oxidoreductase [Deltaproteobacteria bacterium]